MKKHRYIIYLIALILFLPSIVNAKKALFTCEYYASKDSLSGRSEMAALCVIYNNYSYKCYGDYGAKATTDSSIATIFNWEKSEFTSFSGKKHVKKNKKCPPILVMDMDQTIATYGYPYYFAKDNNEAAKIMKEADISSSAGGIAKLKGSGDKSAAEAKVKEYIENLNTRINTWTLQSCIDPQATTTRLDKCHENIKNFNNYLKDWDNEVNSYVNSKTLKEGDQVIKDYRSVREKYDNYMKGISSELKKEEEITNNTNFLAKEKCSDYTYNECNGKYDASGNACITNNENKSCKTKYTCEQAYKETGNCPDKSDYGHTCELSGSTCKDLGTIFSCEDYPDEYSCPKKDETGKKCYWNKEKGCTTLINVSGTGVDADIGKLQCSELTEGTFGSILKEILSFIRFIVPILILAMSIKDYVGAIASQDQSAIKKSSTLLVKRLILGVIIFVLPTLLDFVLKIAGVECGMSGLGY